MAKIKRIFAREIINSKAIPTVEATVLLEDGSIGVGSSPTGTSVGKYESVELRDQDPNRHLGLGVLNAISNIQKVISPALEGMEAEDLRNIDKTLITLDGTKNKARLGTNSILPVSIASAKAQAKSVNNPLYVFLKSFVPSNLTFKIPSPCFNILNGGLHAGNNLDFQEFMIIPATNKNYEDSLILAATVYQSLRKKLEEKGASTLIGDEGGFGPTFPNNREALDMLKESIESGKFRLNYDVFLGLDAAASNFFRSGKYKIKDNQQELNSEALFNYFDKLSEEYRLLYLEDPFSEDDWEGWSKSSEFKTFSSTIVVGDDLTVTNPIRLQMALDKKAISGIIIKPNQIGTIIEAIGVTEMARQAGIKIVVSHRSGETNDDFIADFAVAVSADFVKFGAPARGERVSKYNRLLAINNELKSLQTK